MSGSASFHPLATFLLSKKQGTGGGPGLPRDARWADRGWLKNRGLSMAPQNGSRLGRWLTLHAAGGRSAVLWSPQDPTFNGRTLTHPT